MSRTLKAIPHTGGLAKPHTGGLAKPHTGGLAKPHTGGFWDDLTSTIKSKFTRAPNTESGVPNAESDVPGTPAPADTTPPPVPQSGVAPPTGGKRKTRKHKKHSKKSRKSRRKRGGADDMEVDTEENIPHPPPRRRQNAQVNAPQNADAADDNDGYNSDDTRLPEDYDWPPPHRFGNQPYEMPDFSNGDDNTQEDFNWTPPHGDGNQPTTPPRRLGQHQQWLRPEDFDPNTNTNGGRRRKRGGDIEEGTPDDSHVIDMDMNDQPNTMPFEEFQAAQNDAAQNAEPDVEKGEGGQFGDNLVGGRRRRRTRKSKKAKKTRKSRKHSKKSSRKHKKRSGKRRH